MNFIRFGVKVMTHDDGEFFNYLQSDYVKYEEDMYYVRKEDL